MITNPHVFSNLILILTGLHIFYKYFKLQPFSNRIIWGIFLFSIILNALVELLIFSGLESMKNVHDFSLALERTLGPVCLVSASWCIVMRYKAKKELLIYTIGFGVSLFYCITWYKVQFIGLIIQPFCFIIALLISCLGLAKKEKSAFWIILSLTLLALSTKSQHISLPMHPIDINRYMTVLAIICFGNALRDQYKILF